MTAAKKRFPFSLAVKISILALLALTLVVPLCFIFTALKDVSFTEVVASKKFLSAMGNSFLVGLTATVISVLFAFMLSFIMARSKLRFKGIFAVVFTVPMLIPSIAHGMGIKVLLGSYGLFTRLLGLSGDLDGFWAIVLGSVTYSFPVAFLMLNDVFKYEDRSVYEAADILGIGKGRQFFSLTLPFLRKALISVFFAVFTLVFTDYGVPMIVGGRFTTLPLYMYNEVIGQMKFGVGAIVALVLAIPALAAFLFDLFNKDGANTAYAQKTYIIKGSKARDVISYVIVGVSAAAVLLPVFIFSFVGFFQKYPVNLALTFDNVLKALDMGAGQYLLNSLFISLAVGLIGTVVSYVTAYLTARVPQRGNKLLHLMSILSLAVPGVVLGISYSLAFKGSFLSGTFAILIMVNVVHFFSSPYLLCYNALSKLNKNYEAVAKTMQIGKFRLCKDVLVPQTLDTILEMFSYFFVNSMVTISAVAFLATSTNLPLSLLITQFETTMLIECASFVSLMILLLNGVLKTAVYLVKRRRLIKNA